MSPPAFSSRFRLPTSTEIGSTRWGCCCTNRTTAFILICFILLGDITVGIESWLVTLGIWAPAVKSVILTSPSGTSIFHRNSSNGINTGNFTSPVWLSPSISSSSPTAMNATTMFVVRSLRSWYALDALYCTFDIALALVAFYGLLKYRPKLLKPLRILEFAWLILMCVLLVVGILAFISSSAMLSKFFINVVAWMFSASGEPVIEIEEEKHGEGFSLPIGSVLISIVIQAWILAILAGAVHELRMKHEQGRVVAGEEASGVEYNRMTDFVSPARGPNAGGGGGATNDVPLPTIQSRQTNGGTTVNGFHNSLDGKVMNGVGNYWDVEANNPNRSSNSDDFEVIGNTSNEGRSASSVVVEFEEPFEPHTSGGPVRGPHSKL